MKPEVIREIAEALRPFAELPDDINCNDGRMLAHAGDGSLACGVILRVSDIRRARAMLAALTQEGRG